MNPLFKLIAEISIIKLIDIIPELIDDAESFVRDKFRIDPDYNSIKEQPDKDSK